MMNSELFALHFKAKYTFTITFCRATNKQMYRKDPNALETDGFCSTRLEQLDGTKDVVRPVVVSVAHCYNINESLHSVLPVQVASVTYLGFHLKQAANKFSICMSSEVLLALASCAIERDPGTRELSSGPLPLFALPLLALL
jgi:hypothetical protein